MNKEMEKCRELAYETLYGSSGEYTEQLDELAVMLYRIRQVKTDISVRIRGLAVGIDELCKETADVKKENRELKQQLRDAKDKLEMLLSVP